MTVTPPCLTSSFVFFISFLSLCRGPSASAAAACTRARTKSEYIILSCGSTHKNNPGQKTRLDDLIKDLTSALLLTLISCNLRLRCKLSMTNQGSHTRRRRMRVSVCAGRHTWR